MPSSQQALLAGVGCCDRVTHCDPASLGDGARDSIRRNRHRAINRICVGIGGKPTDVNEKLLKSIASKYPDSSPRYRWIGDKKGLVQHFHQLAGRITRG